MFNGLKTAVCCAGKTALVAAVNHIPHIMFVGGVVTFGVTIYMATKAAPKVKETLDNHNKKAEELDEKLKEAEKQAEEGSESEEKADKVVYSKKEYDKDVRNLYKKTVISVVKDAGPAVATGLISISFFGVAMFLPLEQLGQVSAEYMALDKTFKSYRATVREEEGEEKDRHYMYKTRDVKIRVPYVDDDNNITEEEETITVGETVDSEIIYCKETTPFFFGVEVYDDNMLQQKEEKLTKMLEWTHTVTRNDILRELGMFDTIKKAPLLGNRFGIKWKDEGVNAFKFNIQKIWVPDYTRKNGYDLKYQLSYDEELL